MHWLEQTPIWVIGLAILAALSLAHEAGFRCGRIAADDGSDGKGYLVSSILALLGLMMAFTFNAAQDRFHVREQLVVEEANAIGTAYLRAQTLSDPWRGELSRTLMPYAETRGAYFDASRDAARLSENDRQTAAQASRIWEIVSSAVRANPTPTLNSPLLDAVNHMFDVAAARRAAAHTRVPISILRMLLIFTLSAAAIMGFASASGRRYFVVSTAVLALVTVAFSLILDLDRPSSGTVTIDQRAMVEAIAQIRAMEARKPPVADLQAAPAAVAPARP